MPTITLQIKTRIATRQVFSIQDLKDRYLYGLSIVDKSGRELPDSTFDFFIQAAKVEVEKFLSIKIDLQMVEENRDFFNDDWRNWSQVKVTYPVVATYTMKGYIGGILQADYPQAWLTARQTTDGETYSRLIHIIPNANTSFAQTAAIYTGLYPNIGIGGGGSRTPEYWKLEYVTGFKKLPLDIEQAIGMLASLSILTIGNETLASAMGALGTSSKSVSIDGLSESVSMYVNGTAGIFGARIKQYAETLFGQGNNNGLLERLRDNYGAIIWTC